MTFIIRLISWILGLRNQEVKRELIGTEILRVVDVALRHNVNPASWIEHLARDHPRRDQRAMLRIAERFSAGDRPAAAFSAAPGLFRPETLLALAVADPTHTLPATFRDHLTQRRFIDGNRIVIDERPNRAGQIMKLLFCLFIGVFLALVVLPTLREMFQDLELPLPEVTENLILAGTWFADYWFILLYVLMIYLVARVVLSQSVTFQHALQANFSWKRQWAEQAILLRSLANVVESGHDPMLALQTFGGHHPSPFMRRRWKKSQQESSVWGQLNAMRWITKPEADSLGQLPEPVGVVWLLRRLADLRDFRNSATLSWFGSVWATLRTLVFALLIGFLCMGVFSPLVSMIEEMP